jgi:hypothetical protein
VSRIGLEHVERRLKIEAEHEAQLFGQGLLFFNLENWRLAPRLITWGLKLAGLLSESRGSRIRSHVERAYPWGPALPARWNPDQARGRIAAINGRRRVATCWNDRLYLGWRRYKPAASPSELPARNHVAHTTSKRVTAEGNAKRSVRRFRAFLFQRWQP